MTSPLQQSKTAILGYFAERGPAVYRPREFARVLTNQRRQWGLPSALTLKRFVSFLELEGELRVLRLRSRSYGIRTRYVWGEPSAFAVGLSLGRDAYLSHGTAVFLHGLSGEIPKTIYVNDEQTPKPPPQGTLIQERLDVAFSRQQRESNYVFAWDDVQAMVLSGKHTGRLEVGMVAGPNGEELDVTKLERTLVDIVVRPAYSGGVFHVLEAYEAARERMSVNVLVATLKRLDYIYPYHQAIGFLMERAGYEKRRCNLLRKLGLEYDFYLQHKMTDPQYDPEWRLFFPQGL